MAKFNAGHIVEGRHQGRLLDFTELPGGGASQRHPVMPTAQCILQLLELRDETVPFRRSRSEFRRVAGALHRNSIPMQDFVAQRTCGWSRAKHLVCDPQWITLRPSTEILRSPPDPLCQFCQGLLLQ